MQANIKYCYIVWTYLLHHMLRPLRYITTSEYYCFYVSRAAYKLCFRHVLRYLLQNTILSNITFVLGSLLFAVIGMYCSYKVLWCRNPWIKSHTSLAPGKPLGRFIYHEPLLYYYECNYFKADYWPLSNSHTYLFHSQICTIYPTD